MQSKHRTARAGGRRAARWAAALALVLTSGLAAPALAAGAGGESSLSGVVNLNTATAEELQLLPGIGESRAHAILEVRKTRGSFKSVEELTDVKGIGPAMLEKMRPHLALSGRTTARVESGASKPAAGDAH
jgi:competence protein ComEA